jgi:hypothetical protein
MSGGTGKYLRKPLTAVWPAADVSSSEPKTVQRPSMKSSSLSANDPVAAVF